MGGAGDGGTVGVEGTIRGGGGVGVEGGVRGGDGGGVGGAMNIHTFIEY